MYYQENNWKNRMPGHASLPVRICGYYQELLWISAITIGDALLLLVGVCVVILLIYMIRAVKNIIPAFKALSGILEDTQVVTGMVSSASKEVEDAVSSLSESSVDMAHFISENKNSFKAAVSLINALVAIKKLFS